jgi:hypothetical protein
MTENNDAERRLLIGEKDDPEETFEPAPKESILNRADRRAMAKVARLRAKHRD